MESLNLNRIKILLLKLLKSNGLTVADLFRSDEKGLDWKIDWADDLDSSFMKLLHQLQAALDLYEKAFTNGDLLTAQFGLLRASAFAADLARFFDAIKEDLSKSVRDKRMNWPEFPENYKVPSKYGYKR